MDESTFKCIVITPTNQVVDEQVTYASVPAWDGLVGIASKRAALLVKLGDGPLRLDMEAGTPRRYFLSGGFAQMKWDVLTILTDEAIPVDELASVDAERVLTAARELPGLTDKETATKQQMLDRAWSMRREVGRPG